jgi:RimJ/RimL family protein N-acetyltransferase
MLHKLAPQDYEQARPIFGAWAQTHLNVTAVIDGRAPGAVYVDDARDPRTADVVSGDGHYLAGYAGNDAFNRALNALLPGDTYFGLFYHAESWEEQFAVLLEGKYAVKYPRRYYTLGRPAIPDWRARLPPGFSMRRVDAALLSGLDPEERGALQEAIGETWRSPALFFEHGFGFCLLHGGAVASRCLADFVSGDCCEIGIYTAAAYRRQGLGTLTAAAAVADAADRFAHVGWHCWDNNVGSIGVAENVGFELRQRYSIYFNHWAAENITDMSRDEFRAFAGHYAAEFARQPPASGFPYVVAAKAWCLAGDGAAAVEYLHRAVDVGWLRDRDHLRALWPELFSYELLHNEEGWPELSTRLGRDA